MHMKLIIVDRDGTLIHNDNFFGKEKNWKEEIKFNQKVIDFLKEKDKHATILLITNQSGVARGFFTETRVKKINAYVQIYLESVDINLSGMEYCPYVDLEYTKRVPYVFKSKYIKSATERKPKIDMVIRSLEKIGKKINDFKDITVIGNDENDRVLAYNLNATYIDVRSL